MPRPRSTHAGAGKQYPGYFVVIEGIDLSGKTTLARRLVAAYVREGLRVTAVREPGGTPASERIRRILLSARSSLTPRTELFLYLAARSELVAKVIEPALARGELVIADRFSLSTMAYQIGGRGLPARAVEQADRLARRNLAPDLTIILTVSGRQAAQRRRQSGKNADRIENESSGFFRGVRAEYRRRSRSRRRQVVIDSSLGADAVFQLAKHLLDRRLNRRGIA